MITPTNPPDLLRTGTMNAEEDVVAIVKGLTAAQRAVVMDRSSKRPFYANKREGSPCMALWRKGLLRSAADTIGNNMWAMTDLGLAVRAALTEQVKP